MRCGLFSPGSNEKQDCPQINFRSLCSVLVCALTFVGLSITSDLLWVKLKGFRDRIYRMSLEHYAKPKSLSQTPPCHAAAGRCMTPAQRYTVAPGGVRGGFARACLRSARDMVGRAFMTHGHCKTFIIN